MLFAPPADHFFPHRPGQNSSKAAILIRFWLCLLPDMNSIHVHLLLKAESQCLERTMKRLLVVYANYYNKKLQRIGHVFQDRFRNEPIDSQRYFMACARYIHNNAVKAGISRPPGLPLELPRIHRPRGKSLVNEGALSDCFGLKLPMSFNCWCSLPARIPI